MHILWSSHGWKSGPSLEAHPWHMQEGGFQFKNKDNADRVERRYNSSNGNYPCIGSQFSFDGSGISTAASASMSSCASKKRGMNQMTNYNGSQVKSLKAFYEPVRLSDLEQGQMNLALLHAMMLVVFHSTLLRHTIFKSS